MPGKPGADVFRKRMLDSREERINDLIGLLSRLDSLHQKELVIMGIGAGAYLLPEMSEQLSEVHLIMVNAGVYSPLHELEFMSTTDSLAPANHEFLSYWNLDQASLSRKVEKIITEPYGIDQLAPSSNRNWVSYYNSPVIDDIYNLDQPLLWVTFSEYHLLSLQGKALASQILKKLPTLNYHLIEGSGTLSNDKEMNKLLQYIRVFLQWH
ncbi:MAG: hypothetical protein U5L96_01660 [Owenweeksia sp.]|nr:hypothetical protein [Owenweeksia sp.]